MRLPGDNPLLFCALAPVVERAAAPDEVADEVCDVEECVVVSEGNMGGDCVEVRISVTTWAGTFPAPELDFVTMLVIMVVASSTLEDDVGREVGEVIMGCEIWLGAAWVICGAVEVERTVKGLLDVTIEGPGEEKENDVGVVVMPGMDTVARLVHWDR